MKRYFTCLFIFISLLGIKPSFATTYYISNSGNDSYTGTRPDSAWQTIGKLNATTLQAGDSVLFETGGIFRGQINLLNSGATGQPIYFGSYNSNPANPVISGCKVITGWLQYSGNIYTATVSDTVSNLFEGKVMKTSARYPNSGFLTIDSSGVNTGLYDPRLNIHTNWSGARLKVRSSDTKYEDAAIDSFSNSWLSLATPTVNTLSAGYGYYIDHDFQDLDTAGEWYYDTSSHSLFIYTSTAADTGNVEATVFGYGINAAANNSHITVQGIDFENQGKDGALFTGASGNISFLNCNFRNCYLRAINLNTTSLDTIDHCTFTGILGDGIVLASNSTSAITNCVLSRIGLIPGYGLDGVTQYNAISFNGSGNTVANNLIDTIGFMGITFSGMNNLVDKNLIKSSLSTLNSGSAIAVNNSSSSQSTISDNFIFNTIGNNAATPSNLLSARGISLNQSSILTILHNTVVNTTSFGIYIGINNYGHTIQNNVIYNSDSSQIYFSDFGAVGQTHDNNTTNNIFYCLNDVQHTMLIDGDSLFHPGTFDFNYYCNPYDFYPIYQYPHGIFYNIKPYFLNTWQTEYGDDKNSKASLVKWNSYFIKDTIGDDLIQNGTFTNNFDGWVTEPLTNNNLLLDNDNGFDGGDLKLEIVTDTPQVYVQLHSSPFDYTENKLYQFSFSGKAPKEINLNIFTKDNEGTFAQLGYFRYFPLDTPRSDYSDIFRSSMGNLSANLTFEIRYPDSLMWLDNIHLFMVDATHNDSSKLSKLIYNYSPNTVSVSLSDSTYRDLDGNLVFGHYNLNPYSSYVLTLDSPLFTAVNNVIDKDNLIIFPNPINPALQVLHYDLNGLNSNSEITLQLIDLCGRIVFEEQTTNYRGEVEIPSNVPVGFYLFKAINEGQDFEQKIILFR